MPPQPKENYNNLKINNLKLKNRLMNLFFFKKKSPSDAVSSKLSTKFPQSSSVHFSKSFPLKQLEIDGVRVDYEDNSNSLKKHLSAQDQKRFQDLLHEAQIYPQKVYREVIAWQKTAPMIPELDNLLTYLHLQHKQTKLAEALIKESYENYPDYLFAKINYADQALRKNNHAEIPRIFPSFSLQEIIKTRKHFHVSEFRGFMVLISRYYLKMKEKDLAKSYYQKAYLADPTHPSVVLLEKQLFAPNFLKRLFQKNTIRLLA